MPNTKEQFEQVISLCRELFEKKLKDYGPSWRIMRPQSVTDQIFIKANRIRSLEIKGTSMVDEGIRPEFIAIVNYGVIGLVQLALGFADTTDITIEKALELYDKYIAETKELMYAKNHDYDEAWRSMVSNTEMARELGYLHAPDNVLITIDEINKYPPEKVVLITTGSQGEPLSALSRMAQASHRQVRVGPNDFIIISARPIPGNEKTVTKVVNGLLTLGAEVIYENMYDTHVSGHACQEEQKLMLTLAHPQFFLPVHGEFKQLKRHAETAEHLGYIPKQNIYIAENGQNIRLSADGMTVENTVTAGAVMVDGYGVGDVGNVVLRDRHHLSEDGIIIVTAAIDGSNGQVLSGPDLVSRGFVYVRESEELMEGARTQVEMALDRSLADNLHDWASVKARVREALSSYIYRRTKRSPMILPILLEV